MTDEVMAEEWLDERYLKDMGVRKPCKQAFLAGLHSDVHTDNSKVIAELKDEVKTWKKASELNSYKAHKLGERANQLLKDKGNLIDENNELKKQIEKMKKYIKACWGEENLNDYSSYITNSSDEFRDLVKELNDEVRKE